MTYNPLFDLPDMGKRDIPRREDHPLILAWIRLCSDPQKRCERYKCTKPAYVEVAEYEDGAWAKREMEKSQIIFLQEIEDRLWRRTVEEQLAGSYTVYQTAYHCKEHILRLLMFFLHTQKHEELSEILDGMADKRYTMVQWHRLSYPELGLCALVKPQITTPEELLAVLKHERLDWKLQR